jgi:hypothetical protein
VVQVYYHISEPIVKGLNHFPNSHSLSNFWKHLPSFSLCREAIVILRWAFHLFLVIYLEYWTFSLISLIFVDFELASKFLQAIFS